MPANTTPPFDNGQSDYAGVLALLVPDTKTSRTDNDFTADALERYAERFPCWEQQDIGDGSTTAWDLSASPFAYAAASDATPALGFVLGYSDQWPLKAEDLGSAATPQRPPVFREYGEDGDFWIEERTVSSLAKRYLVFNSAPGTSLVRVHFRKRWSFKHVPLHHQMAVVYAAAALKCEALASRYRSMVDSVGGSDVFAALQHAESYKEQATSHWAAFSRTLGTGGGSAGDAPLFATARAETGRVRVFDRGIG